MTDNIPHPANTEDRGDDHQHAIEACEHASDALRNGDFSYALTLLDEAIAAGERAHHDTERQTQREIAYDCYD